ncbi:hypothetical protein Lalb_Chr23g0265891 [Lupinus albus]|uniref:Uncharacterized protein n=1 Tax=Lupinus albus TaxID=3870 RepID=A0A6A4NDE0_LUPAL|nr:hypothetical protein Lalb_Chr23g0265891 [Lupinus albus]
MNTFREENVPPEVYFQKIIIKSNDFTNQFLVELSINLSCFTNQLLVFLVMTVYL